MSDEHRRALLSWYRANGRKLPWRETADPYAIWISEIMLQQTQVATALPYYDRWMAQLPTLRSLAQSDEQQVLALWQGLGYYRRCRLLLQGARYVQEHGWPASAQEWRRVPGVGPYTAGAIASISLNEVAPVVDGNVERVYSRFCDDPATSTLNKNAWAWANNVIDRVEPAAWNQALMELGARVCRPSSPDCSICPLSTACLAKRNGTVGSRPAPRGKQINIDLIQFVSVPFRGGSFGLQQIVKGKWWHGMWSFPYLDEAPDLPHLGTVKHTVTRHRISLAAYLDSSSRVEGLTWFGDHELDALPMPAPQRKVLALARAALRESKTPAVI